MFHGSPNEGGLHNFSRCHVFIEQSMSTDRIQTDNDNRFYKSECLRMGRGELCLYFSDFALGQQ